MLYSMEEIQKIIWLFSRAGLNQVELEYANSFFQRLVTFCTPPKVEEKTDEDIDGE